MENISFARVKKKRYILVLYTEPNNKMRQSQLSHLEKAPNRSGRVLILLFLFRPLFCFVFFVFLRCFPPPRNFELKREKLSTRLQKMFHDENSGMSQESQQWGPTGQRNSFRVRTR